MIRRRSLEALLALPALIATLSIASLASADALPPNSCTGAAGDTCDTAGTTFDQPGVCVNETCKSGTGGGSFPCILCEIADGGGGSCGDGMCSAGETCGSCPKDCGGCTTKDASAPDSAEGSDAASPDGGGSTMLGSSSGCTAASVGAGGDATSWLLGLGVVGLIASSWSRRRRS